MSEYFSSNKFNKLNSQYLNIKNFLNCGPYFSCSSKCECIFFFDVTKFFTVPATSSHHCQSGSARMKLLRQVLREIGHFEFRDFFCIHRSTNRNGAFPRISFTIFSLTTFRKNPFYYVLLVFLD